MIINPYRPAGETLGKVWVIVVGVGILVLLLTMAANLLQGQPAWEPVTQEPTPTAEQPNGN